MTAPVLLPYLFKRFGRHKMVLLVDPAQIDLAQPFFRFALPDKADSGQMLGFDEWLAAQPEPDPDYSDFAGIFHVSRCGSTLLSRNLADSGQALVLSEPPFFRILRHRLDGTVSGEVALRASMAMLAAWRGWARQRGLPLVVKFNSQLHLYLDELLAAMAGARFLFLHREPLAVFESLDRKPAPYLQNDARLAEVSPPECLTGVAADAKLLAAAARYITALDRFVEVSRDDVLSVAYPQLGARYGEILAHFGLDPARAPAWSADRDAKADAASAARAYVPVSRERLQAFASANAQLLAVTGAQYRAFLESEAAKG